MIVGTRLADGTIAKFDVDTDDYKIARNEVIQELAMQDQMRLETPFLALITKGHNTKLIAHLVKPTPPTKSI